MVIHLIVSKACSLCHQAIDHLKTKDTEYLIIDRRALEQLIKQGRTGKELEAIYDTWMEIAEAVIDVIKKYGEISAYKDTTKLLSPRDIVPVLIKTPYEGEFYYGRNVNKYLEGDYLER